MKIAVFTFFFAPAFLGGGPIRTLTAMLSGAPETFETVVVTSNGDLGRREALDVVSDTWVTRGSSRVFYSNARSLRSMLGAVRATRSWAPDAIYVNSFFDAKFSILPQLLYLIGFFRPQSFAIAPRGEFNAGALNIKVSKKKLYIRLFRLLGLDKRVLWHASTKNEVDEIKQLFGEDSRIIVRENDTALPHVAAVPGVLAPAAQLRAVSLSRLSPKKGVETLLEGLRSVSVPVSLDIVGPAEDLDYYERCRQIAEQLPPNVEVRFLGPRPPEEIRSTLATYDLMACPTKGENFGHVIAEALSVGCPVMCADVTPWTSRLAAGGGVIVDENSATGWAHAITDYARLSPEEIFNRRLAAAHAYNEWKSDSTDPHFFSLLQDATVKASGNA